jgi:hypothetical protein
VLVVWLMVCCRRSSSWAGKPPNKTGEAVAESELEVRCRSRGTATLDVRPGPCAVALPTSRQGVLPNAAYVSLKAIGETFDVVAGLVDQRHPVEKLGETRVPVAVTGSARCCSW